MTSRWALPGLLFLLLPSCHSLKLGHNTPTEGANPYESSDNAGYSQGGFYGDPAAAGQGTTAGMYPAEGQTFGGYNAGSSEAVSDRAQVAPFSESGYSGGESTRSAQAAKPKPVASTVHKPADGAKKPSSTRTAATTASKKSPALASTARRSESHTTAGTKGGSVVKAVYQPPGSSSTPKKKIATIHRVHTVKRGDTLSALASRYDVTVAAVKKQNHLSSDLIRVGQRLSID